MALNMIKATEPTKATNNSSMVKPPSGTNHRQFRIHQLRFALEGSGGALCSTELFYFNHQALCN